MWRKLLVVLGAWFMGFGGAASLCGQGTGGGTSFTTSTAEHSTFNDLPATARAGTFTTRLVGALENGPVLVDVTVNGALGDPAAQAALVQASAQLLNAGGLQVLYDGTVHPASRRRSEWREPLRSSLIIVIYEDALFTVFPFGQFRTVKLRKHAP